MREFNYAYTEVKISELESSVREGTYYDKKFVTSFILTVSCTDGTNWSHRIVAKYEGSSPVYIRSIFESINALVNGRYEYINREVDCNTFKTINTADVRLNLSELGEQYRQFFEDILSSIKKLPLLKLK